MDKALSYSLRPPQSSQTGAMNIRELKLAAMEVLQALGYRHSAGAAVDGDIDVQEDRPPLTALDVIVQTDDTEENPPGVHAKVPAEPPVDIEDVIKMAQECHDDEAAEWPIRMLREWRENDPKRAVRVMLRKALGRALTTEDTRFATVSKVFEHQVTKMRRTLHVTTVSFQIWGHEFEGPYATTIQEAERGAFRKALDFYHEWICWED